MKAYLTTIGENTTDLCEKQLKKFGFEVIKLDKKEPWIQKYKTFISTAMDDCLRIDADMIVNKNIREVMKLSELKPRPYMASLKGYDFYKNDIGVVGGIFYSSYCLELLRQHIDMIETGRPETSAWRNHFILDNTLITDIFIGVHGLGQSRATIQAAKTNKINRHQIEDYDFDLAINLQELCKKF